MDWYPVPPERPKSNANNGALGALGVRRPVVGFLCLESLVLMFLRAFTIDTTAREFSEAGWSSEGGQGTDVGSGGYRMRPCHACCPRGHGVGTTRNTKVEDDFHAERH